MEDDFTEKLAQEVQKIKENKEWQVEYMTLLMREREKYKEGIEEGRAKGRAEGEIQGAIKTCKNLDLSLQETIQYSSEHFDLSLPKIEETVKQNWI